MRVGAPPPRPPAAAAHEVVPLAQLTAALQAALGVGDAPQPPPPPPRVEAPDDSEHTRRELAALCSAWGVTAFRALPNFAWAANSLLPPTGYVAKISGKAPVPATMLENAPLFFNQAVFRLQAAPWGQGPVPPAVQATIRARLQLFLGDRSPHPPDPRAPGRGWTCSLGPGGSAGLYSVTTKQQAWFIVVRCSLDDRSLEALWDALREANRRRVPIAELVKDPGSVLSAAQQLAYENAGRVAALVAWCADAELVSAAGARQPPRAADPPPPPEDEDEDDDDEEDDEDEEETEGGGDGDGDAEAARRRRLRARLEAALDWLDTTGVGDREVPAWFRVPARAPAGVPEPPPHIRRFALGAALQRLPAVDNLRARRGVRAADAVAVPVLRCEANVLRAAGDDVLFFSNATPPAPAAERPIFASNPRQNVFVPGWSPDTGGGGGAPPPAPRRQDELEAAATAWLPQLSRARELGPGDRAVHCWLDPAHVPLCHCREFAAGADGGGESAAGTYFAPALVRHAMADLGGLVRPESTLEQRLLVEFRVDPDYEPLDPF